MISRLSPLARAAELLAGEVRGDQVLCPGPDHSESDRSLSVKPDVAAPDGFVTHSFAGDDVNECRDYVRGKLGLPPFEPKANQRSGGGTKPFSPTIDEFIYRDENGRPYLKVVRTAAKQFFQYHWTGELWKAGAPKGPKLPYRLQELIAAPPTTPIYVSEGEGKADLLAKLGFVATSASEGAGKWTSDLNKWFEGRTVFILPDNDRPGYEHGQLVARNLDPIAHSVCVVELPGLPLKGDVKQWLEQDPSGARLRKECECAPLWEPNAATDKRSDVADEALVAELAALSKLDYAKRRKDAAEAIGIGVGELDKIVAEARGDRAGPESMERWRVDRWPDPVATSDLLNELAAVYARYLILPEHGATVLALWTLHACALDAAYCSPLLMLVSPEPRCGKSTVLKVLYWTCPRTALASNISGAAIYRYIETYTPTLLLDEAETFVADNEGVRGILNSGHDRVTAIVIRQVGDNHDETKEFSTWAPKAIASIGKLAATLRDRAIILPMRRKKRTEFVEKLRGRDTDEFRAIREKACKWADDNVEALKSARPSIPDGLNDRAADNWELLLAIADLAGGDWPARARAAAVCLSGDADAKGETIGVELLAAIKSMFETLGVDRITSEDLAERLAKDKDSPWAAYGRAEKPITQRQIAAVLDRYGVRPDSIRIPGIGTKKGYLFAWFADAFETYLPAPSLSPPSGSGTPEHAHSHGHK